MISYKVLIILTMVIVTNYCNVVDLNEKYKIECIEHLKYSGFKYKEPYFNFVHAMIINRIKNHYPDISAFKTIRNVVMHKLSLNEHGDAQMMYDILVKEILNRDNYQITLLDIKNYIDTYNTEIVNELSNKYKTPLPKYPYCKTIINCKEREDCEECEEKIKKVFKDDNFLAWDDKKILSEYSGDGLKEGNYILNYNENKILNGDNLKKEIYFRNSKENKILNGGNLKRGRNFKREYELKKNIYIRNSEENISDWDENKIWIEYELKKKYYIFDWEGEEMCPIMIECKDLNYEEDNRNMKLIQESNYEVYRNMLTFREWKYELKKKIYFRNYNENKISNVDMLREEDNIFDWDVYSGDKLEEGDKLQEEVDMRDWDEETKAYYKYLAQFFNDNLKIISTANKYNLSDWCSNYIDNFIQHNK